MVGEAGRPRTILNPRLIALKIDGWCYDAICSEVKSLSYMVPVSTFIRGIVREWVQKNCEGVVPPQFPKIPGD